MTLSDEVITYFGADLSSTQTLRLPSNIPRWLDLRHWLMLGWVTIETPGYLATAKVHWKKRWGIAGTRVHTLYVWPCTDQTRFIVNSAAYRNHCGNVIDHLDDDGRDFLNLILEYFQ